VAASVLCTGNGVLTADLLGALTFQSASPRFILAGPGRQQYQRQDRIMKEIPLSNGQFAKVDDQDYEWLSHYNWYAYYDPQRGITYAAHDTPSGRRVFMHDVIMGLDTLEDESSN